MGIEKEKCQKNVCIKNYKKIVHDQISTKNLYRQCLSIQSSTERGKNTNI